MKKPLRIAFLASSLLISLLPRCTLAQSAASSQAVNTGPAATEIPFRDRAHLAGRVSALSGKQASSANHRVQLNETQTDLQATQNPDSKDTYFTSIDVSDAGDAAGQGTLATAINLEGTITGFYVDVNFGYHGFVRQPDTKLTTFDVPGSSAFTQPTAINAVGFITGSYCDVDLICHGFLRARNGTTVSFDAAGIGFQPFQGTFPDAINLEGAITGYFYDAINAIHGFVLDRRGVVSTFDVPGAGTEAFQGTNPTGISLEGVITGYYYDANNVPHGFLRYCNGDFTTLDPPSSQLTEPNAINLEGQIAGTYQQPAENPFQYLLRGFVRNSAGAFTTFDAATYGPCCIFTYAMAINLDGTVAGYDNDGLNVYHGFLRTHDGTILTFDAPGAGKGNFQGTIAVAINPQGTTTGHYIDSSDVNHGFLRRASASEKRY